MAADERLITGVSIGAVRIFTFSTWVAVVTQMKTSLDWVSLKCPHVACSHLLSNWGKPAIHINALRTFFEPMGRTCQREKNVRPMGD